jgi:hypothetical protein
MENDLLEDYEKIWEIKDLLEELMKYSQDPGHINPCLEQIYEELDITLQQHTMTSAPVQEVEEQKMPGSPTKQSRTKAEVKIPPVNKNVDPFANLSEMNIEVTEEQDQTRIAEML